MAMDRCITATMCLFAAVAMRVACSLFAFVARRSGRSHEYDGTRSRRCQQANNYGITAILRRVPAIILVGT